VTYTPTAPRTNPTAIAALLSAVFGFACFWGIGGALAIVLGLVARREVQRSEGRETGSGLANVGIVLGAVNLVAFVVVIGVAIALMVRPPAPPGIGLSPAVPVLPAPSSHPLLPKADRNLSASRQRGVHEAWLGKVRLVDLGPYENLSAVLSSQRKAAASAGEILLVFVVAPNCLPCNGVTLALRDARMQKALAGVRLVRLDAAEFGPELIALGIPVETVPGFALLGGGERALDYVHGGEWDADIAENIAPVLGAFVKGRYGTRRHRNALPSRPDETQL
jgi:hypothetical protein